ncbi:MAG: NAD/NADP octopine/nopaline dehydrogenase family protein [Synergistaceae bacterium]|nr:NAD/NADP octopine/nopaline dehydrogenase family protein [Synergistaceae bacterium]
MEYLKNKPVAVLGSGAVGKTIAADCKLAGSEVRLYGSEEFAEKSLGRLDRTGITLGGIQRNRDCFERSGRAYVDVVTSDIAEAVKGAGIICVATTAWRHEELFRKLVPVLEDEQVVMIFTDNWGSLLLRKIMRDAGCTKRVIVGGWSSAPYGTRLENVNGYRFPKLNVKYRAVTLRGAALPDSDTAKFLEASKYLPSMDSVTQGDGAVKGDTVLDIDFANVNPVIHVPASVLGVGVMENWGVLFGEGEYSMYSHALCKSICEVQYKFYGEEISIAQKIGVGCPVYKRDMFFSRRSILTQEYMGLDNDGNDNIVFPLDKPSHEGSTGPDSINHRYLTEDIPVSCKMYHDLGKIYGVETPVIDSMITLGGAFHGRDFFTESRYSPEYLGIGGMSREKLVHYLRTLED